MLVVHLPIPFLKAALFHRVPVIVLDNKIQITKYAMHEVIIIVKESYSSYSLHWIRLYTKYSS